MTSCVYIVGLGDRSERRGVEWKKKVGEGRKIEQEEEQRKKMGEMCTTIHVKVNENSE